MGSIVFVGPRRHQTTPRPHQNRPLKKYHLFIKNNDFSLEKCRFGAHRCVLHYVLKLHPCNKTLNSRNLGFAKDSFKVSFGFRTLWRPRLIKDPKNVKNHWLYCVFAQKYWKTIGFTVCSLKKVEKLHPCNKTLNSRNLGFAKDSFKVSFGFRTLWRPRLIKDPKKVNDHWFYCVFAQKC